MKRILLAGLLASTLLFVACGGDDDSEETQAGAGDAVDQWIDMLQKGQGGRLYEMLHPAQQEIIPRDQFITCERGLDFQIENIEIDETYPESVTIPGTNVEAESTAVTFTIQVKAGEGTRENTQTLHAFNVDGEWRMVMSDPAPYANGQCPS